MQSAGAGNLGVSPCSRGIRTQWVWTGEEIRALDDGQASSGVPYHAEPTLSSAQVLKCSTKF